MAHEAAIEASGSAVHGGSANAQGRNHIIGRGRLCDARATGVVYSELLIQVQWCITDRACE